MSKILLCENNIQSEKRIPLRAKLLGGSGMKSDFELSFTSTNDPGTIDLINLLTAYTCVSTFALKKKKKILRFSGSLL